jgi:hypothetical protein
MRSLPIVTERYRCIFQRSSLHFPTIRTLEALAPHGTLEQLLEWAAARAREGVPCIFPEIEKREGEARVIVAGRDSGALE